jgi:hypothetical protein
MTKKTNKKLSKKKVRAGERRAMRVFRSRIASKKGWVTRKRIEQFRGLGRSMVRKVYAVARHLEGAKLSPSLARRGVDNVNLRTVRLALRRVADGWLSAPTRGRRVSMTGRSLVRFASLADR